jgi:hypothetical protein
MRAHLFAATAVAALLTTAAAAQTAAPAPAAGPVPSLAAPPVASPAAAKPPVAADPAAPKGKLSDAARPPAYRLAFVIDPDQPRFSGHDEIDAVIRAPMRKLYLHGRDLTVAGVMAKVGGRTIPGTYTQVDPTGVVRLDFAATLPAGAVTLVFDYDGAFGENASGLYRVKVKDKWYSWTQFESIDARAAYPSFDEPGFKTPFTISVTTRPGNTVVSNAPEAQVTRLTVDPQSAAARHARADGQPVPTEMERHDFAVTRPLPTYLVAMVTGPFLRDTGAVPATAQRGAPLPLGVVATQAQKGKLAYAMDETPRIVSLLERYFDQPFPFPKLDQIASPVMGGAMENAGADIYGDGILLQPADASTNAKQVFGMVVAHELSHQWFGDLVTPAWWDDIWLNESFANWMGYRIGNEWRPELNIGVGALEEGCRAMNTDALEVGRPIHQRIERNNQIDGAFDGITYGKGGQVVAMIAAYLGDEKFRAGVRLHVSRHMYGNATSEQFFAALADAAKDPGVLAALKSFVDQPGVPVVTFTHAGSQLVASQSRYAFLGSRPAAERWTIPLCWRVDTAKSCTLLGTGSKAVAPAPKTGVLMPNVGGTGYYRFDLPAADWTALIATGASLSPGEAVATNDSLWASFRAGHAPASALVAAAKAFATNPDSGAAVSGGERLAGLRLRGLIPADAVPAYRKLISAIYAPRLQAIGFDPAQTALPGDTPDRQKLRAELVGLIADEGDEPMMNARLERAAEAYVGGDRKALAPAYLGTGLALYVGRTGQAGAKRLVELALTSEDPTVRQTALGAAAAGLSAADAPYMLNLDDKRLRPFDQAAILATLVGNADTAAMAGDWILANYAKMANGNGIFLTSRLPALLANQCGVDKAARIEAELGPKVKAIGAGELEFERSVEQVRHCGDLKTAKAAEIGAAIKAG